MTDVHETTQMAREGRLSQAPIRDLVRLVESMAARIDELERITQWLGRE